MKVRDFTDERIDRLYHLYDHHVRRDCCGQFDERKRPDARQDFRSLLAFMERTDKRRTSK